MDQLLNAAIRIGPLTLLIGLGISVVSLLRQLTGPDRAGLLLRALKTAGIGALGFGAGSAAGIALFCSSENAGNLCGLGGLFGVGPFVAGLCIAIYTLVRRRPARAKR